jgi:predicted Rossmann-fold nucleotide-binding protein
VLTLVQTGKSKPVPIILFGTQFWKRLINFEFLIEEGTISAENLDLFHYTDDPQEAWELIRAFYQL